MILSNQPPGDAEALVKAYKVRRCVDVYAKALRLQHGTEKGTHRTFAVGAGNVQHRREIFLRISERRKKPADAIENKIDTFGVERKQPFEDCVARLGIAHRD